MASIHYLAAWTECGCLLTCDDHHSSIGEAFGCVRCAGGYVVAAEEGAMRSLTPQEEAEFQSIVHCAVPPAPTLIKSPSGSPPPQAVGETLLELVLRLMSAYGFGPAKDSEIRLGSSGDLRSGGDEQQPKAA